jgi:hypothetical protein
MPSKKVFNTAQFLYTTTEKEFLSSIETCKEYKNILLSYHVSITVLTEYANYTFNWLKPLEYVFRTYWLLNLEENGVSFEYLPGKKNVGAVADALSRLDMIS